MWKINYTLLNKIYKCYQYFILINFILCNSCNAYHAKVKWLLNT